MTVSRALALCLTLAGAAGTLLHASGPVPKPAGGVYLKSITSRVDRKSVV